MFNKLTEKFNKRFRNQLGTGCYIDIPDDRDLDFEDIAFGAAPVDWETGYDIEKRIGITIPIKDQNGSLSCVGQAYAYYIGVLNSIEVGYYDEASAKAIYSQIALPRGGAYLRDGAKLAVDWGALIESLVPSYENTKPPSEEFMRDLSWKNDNLDKLAKRLQAKQYREINTRRTPNPLDIMDLIAVAIRDYHGMVGGVLGTNNGTWRSNEPKPPTSTSGAWGHAIYFGKFGKDRLGKFIATPNSWNERGKDELHPDGWQKLREDYFNPNYIFNPWTLVDKPNCQMSEQTKQMVKELEKKIIIEGEGVGRKGIIINGKLREITKERAAEACLYALANNNLGKTVSTKLFEEIETDKPF